MFGNDFFMVKFEAKEDRLRVINGGPWMIFDHILFVRMWMPQFVADKAVIDKTLIWVRIPSLSVLFFRRTILWL